MDRGLYVAASGMLAEQARQDQLSNDLANLSTAGYKADRVTQASFGQLLLSNTRTGQALGTAGLGVAVTKQTTNFDQAPLKQTDEPLDLAVEGQGFFAVRTAQGIRYTRDGSFQAGSNGTLVDQLGNPVLGPGRQPVRLKPDGTVDATQVGLFDVPKPAKQGDSLFTGVARGTATGVIRTGMLEGSGVDSARTMVDMMASMRTFESGQRAITTIDETLKQAASQVGSLTG
jgi:flagellar basal-body rod protein FlgF